MNIFYTILAIVIGLVVLKFILKLTIKIFATILIVVALVVTGVIMFVQPKMHKTFNFNVIEKILKINPDGSTSIIETTTTNEIKKENK